VREPSLLPVFGKLGVKPPVLIAAAPITSKIMHKMANRIREILSLHGGPGIEAVRVGLDNPRPGGSVLHFAGLTPGCGNQRTP
jgi:hypothetical protein